MSKKVVSKTKNVIQTLDVRLLRIIRSTNELFPTLISGILEERWNKMSWNMLSYVFIK